jgi:hypothetical protein
LLLAGDFVNVPAYEHFRFKVGEFVQSSFVSVQRDKLKRSSSDILRDTFQIVERLYQECPGGVQLHYLVRPIGFLGGDRNYVRYNEIELAPLEQESPSC